MAEHVSRRSVLGSGAMALLATPGIAAALPVTPRNEMGPFYRRGAPNQPNLRRAGEPGLPLELSGRVLTTDSQPIANASIELWHADHGGHYDIAGNHFRAKLLTASDGAYRVSTIMPGHYPDRVCQHIHFLVSADGHETLVTQLYFASDPVFEGDPATNYPREPLIGDPSLIRPVVLKEAGAASLAECRFDLGLAHT